MWRHGYNTSFYQLAQQMASPATKATVLSTIIAKNATAFPTIDDYFKILTTCADLTPSCLLPARDWGSFLRTKSQLMWFQWQNLSPQKSQACLTQYSATVWRVLNTLGNLLGTGQTKSRSKFCNAGMLVLPLKTKCLLIRDYWKLTRGLIC